MSATGVLSMLGAHAAHADKLDDEQMFNVAAMVFSGMRHAFVPANARSTAPMSAA